MKKAILFDIDSFRDFGEKTEKRIMRIVPTLRKEGILCYFIENGSLDGQVKDKNVTAADLYVVSANSEIVHAGEVLNIETVGVCLDGDTTELKEAGADYVVRSIYELERFLLRTDDDNIKLSYKQLLAELVKPFAIFMIVKTVLAWILALFVETNANGIAVISAVSILVGGLAIMPIAKRSIEDAAELDYLKHFRGYTIGSIILYVLGIITLCGGINLLFGITSFTKVGDYSEIGEVQSSASVLLSILCYGILAPIGEEIMFRGSLMNALKRFLKPATAVFFSSLIFGIYHGNLVQALFALLMGLIISYGYELFGEFKYALIAHMGMNIFAVVIEETLLKYSWFTNIWMCVGLLVAGAFLMTLLEIKRRKKKL